MNGTWVNVLTNLTAGDSLTPADVTSVTADQTGTYRVVYNSTGPYGSTVVSVPLNVYGPPQQASPAPTNALVQVGQNYTLPVVNFTSSTNFTSTVCASSHGSSGIVCGCVSFPAVRSTQGGAADDDDGARCLRRLKPDRSETPVVPDWRPFLTRNDV